MLNRIAADIQVFKVMHPTGGLCSNFACFCCCYHNFIRFLCQAVMTFEFWNKNLCFWFQFYCTRLQFFKGMRGNPTASTWDACGVSCASSGRKKCQTQKSMNASTWTACRWMKRQKKENLFLTIELKDLKSGSKRYQRFLRLVNVPIQFRPSPVYPGFHVHTYHPCELLQTALTWHFRRVVLHASVSFEKINKWVDEKKRSRRK